MRGEYVRVVRVEHGGLHRGGEQRLRVVHQVGVQRVVPGDQDGERALGLPAGPAGLLPERGPGTRVPGHQDGVQTGDVDPEFEGGGGGEAEQPAGVEFALQGPALVGEVAAAVGGDPVGERAAQLVLGLERDEFGGPPGADEDDGAGLPFDQVGQQVGGLGGGGPADRRTLLTDVLGEGRFPQPEDHRAARGGVVGDRGGGQTGQPAGGDGRVGSGGRGEQEDGGGAVAGTDPPQSAQYLGHVRAEHAAVAVALVDHDVAERLEEGGPAGVRGQDAPVQHVRIGEDVGGVLADPLAFLGRGVAVVEGGPDAGRGEFRGPAALVGGECLGGGEVERGRAPAVACLGAVQQVGQHRRQVSERLARGGPCGDHHRLTGFGQIHRLGLVGPGLPDSHVLGGRGDLGPDPVGPRRITGGPGGKVLRMGEPVRPSPGGGQGHEQCLGQAVTRRHEDPVCHRRDGESS